MTQSSGEKTPDDESMRDRLSQLTQDLGARKQQDSQVTGTGPINGPGSLGNAMSLGFRVMSEFVAAVGVGALIGWQADRWLGTSPFLLIIFLALGTAAGFWTVYRLATKPTGLPGKR